MDNKLEEQIKVLCEWIADNRSCCRHFSFYSDTVSMDPKSLFTILVSAALDGNLWTNLQKEVQKLKVAYDEGELS